MLKNGRPYHLPQVHAPYDIVLKKLDDDDIKYSVVELTPSEDDGIQPSQNVVYSDEISSATLDDNKPIWIADNKICDGHHRYFKAMFDNKPIIGIKIELNFMDACRVLNKIQDIYEYEQGQQMEEVVGQDVINTDNQIDSGVSDSEFLASLEEDNTMVQQEIPSVNQQSIVAYRKEPIKENSVVGNFFSLKPIKGFSGYQIEFDNLLDTHALGVVYKDSQNPADIMAKIWFPHVNFEKLSEQYGMPSINLKNKAIAEKARKMGFDGIKYGDTLIQGLK